MLNLLNMNIVLPLMSLTTPITSDQTLEVQDTSFVSGVLLLMILISLVLTFHNKGTTVHKVLGLLLVSIFVVFLWMLQTQFLFIYIVYILAFISAVLMLFLSVVLMLPISTLTSKNLSTDKHITHGLAPFAITLDFEVLAVFIAIAVTVYTLIISVYLLIAAYVYESDIIIKDGKYSLAEFQFLTSSRESTSNPEDFTACIQLFSGCARFFFILAVNMLYWATNSLYLVLENAYNTIYSFSTLKRNGYWILINFKHVREAAVQTYLFLGVLGSLFVAFCTKQVTPVVENCFSLETTLGLGQIKTLLYGYNSAFLIFSTIVLLVALIGAAVMTRNKH